jgi:hypothetical protein
LINKWASNYKKNRANEKNRNGQKNFEKLPEIPTAKHWIKDKEFRII